jgi:hypothetical protein
MRTRTLAAGALCLLALGCSEATSTTERQPVSQKVRIENLQPRVEKSYRLSEAESIKVVIIPGFPMGERCLVYSNATSSAMQCREVLPSEQ